MSDAIKEITDADFESDIIQSDKPALVDFWAPWCGPCKAVAPVIDALAADFGDRVTFAKINVDDNPNTPGQYGIKSIPTLLFFHNGRMVDQIVGMTSRQKIESILASLAAGTHQPSAFVMS